jgi:hypothetical protein
VTAAGRLGSTKRYAFFRSRSRGLLSRHHREVSMSDHQFRVFLAHIRVIIAIVGVQAGIMLAFAWEYLPAWEFIP